MFNNFHREKKPVGKAGGYWKRMNVSRSKNVDENNKHAMDRAVRFRTSNHICVHFTCSDKKA